MVQNESVTNDEDDEAWTEGITKNRLNNKKNKDVSGISFNGP